jgi:hypothetical protein
MKNQYFGDINDYRKYGLLRSLQSDGHGTLLVAWMLTPDDGGRDGGLRSYLDAPVIWRKYDIELFDGLGGMLRTATQPFVSLIKESGLLPRAKYYSSMVPDRRFERDIWFKGLLRAASKADLVFLDPDNGIEVPSKPIGRKGSSKYVSWQEIKILWDSGCSLLIYQHFTREHRDTFTRRLLFELREHTGAPFSEAFRTPHVLFLLAAQERHAERFARMTARISNRWMGQIEAVGLINNPFAVLSAPVKHK